METLRTFIALELPAEILERLARLQQRLMQRCSGVRWVKPGAMHLTLKFLGPTREDQVSGVAGVLEQAARGAAPFQLEVAGIGAFPNTRNPKVIWAGIGFDTRLADFQEQLEAGLARIGFPKEKRSFAPHLTLGRVREGAARKELGSLIDEYGSEAIGRVAAERVVFFRSELMPAGPVYSVLSDINLHAST
jgi:2'-5' RNA ligase